MRNKDSILLEKCYNKINGSLIQEGIEDMEFIQEITLDYINSEEKDREIVRDLGVNRDIVTLKYKIQMEVRKWGIKSIEPYAMKLEPFKLTKMDEDFQEKVIKEINQIDLSEAQIDKEDSTGLRPSSIVLFLDSNLNVVPDKCTVSFN
jgi:hypothetical protein